MRRYLRGDQLLIVDRLHVLSAYTGRHGSPEYAGDEHWLVTHKWPVTRKGEIDKRARWAEPCLGEEKDAGIAALVKRRLLGTTLAPTPAGLAGAMREHGVRPWQMETGSDSPERNWRS